jgi:hypothetical protein
MEIKADVSDLLKFARLLGNIPAATNANVARAINTSGRNIMLATARRIADRTGLSVEAVVARIKITPATPSNWQWKMDLSELPPAGDMEEEEDVDLARADADILVKIVTAGDEMVCPICNDAASENPYSLSEIHDMQATRFLGEGEDVGLLHPHCRCVLKPYTSLRKIPVSIGEMGIEAEPMTAKQIADAIQESLVTTFRAI